MVALVLARACNFRGVPPALRVAVQGELGAINQSSPIGEALCFAPLLWFSLSSGIILRIGDSERSRRQCMGGRKWFV